jgi:hypothetical protein
VIFLSHSSSDKSIVRLLANDLILCGHQIWLDERKLMAGDKLPDSLTQAINESATMLIFISKTSLNSSWVQYEMSIALQHIRVIPCIIGDIKNYEIPEDIANTVYVDFREACHYANSLCKLLSAIATGNSLPSLPLFDIDLFDHYISQNKDTYTGSWIISFLKCYLKTRIDESERAWIYRTLAKIGGLEMKAFLEQVISEETGFAKRGVEEALDMLK